MRALDDPRPARVDTPLRDPLREAFDRRLRQPRLGRLARRRDLAPQAVDDRRAEPDPALAERVRVALEVRDAVGDLAPSRCPARPSANSAIAACTRVIANGSLPNTNAWWRWRAGS